MFAINAILMILFHLAPTAGGMAWSIYQNNGVHLVVPQSSKGTTMKPKIVIHNHFRKPVRDGGPGSGPQSGGGGASSADPAVTQHLAKMNDPGTSSVQKKLARGDLRRHLTKTLGMSAGMKEYEKLTGSNTFNYMK